ncbi:hypothetical protein, partial [Methyloversatilis sp.]|uniref:hypothetical protein n=1 Tax=Methyloversatilis sp. TaxID=2569862 RepID=UPI002736ECD0
PMLGIAALTPTYNGDVSVGWGERSDAQKPSPKITAPTHPHTPVRRAICTAARFAAIMRRLAASQGVNAAGALFNGAPS